MQKSNIIWLASYPKSGNTWFRSFLTALFHEKELDINELEEGKIFSRRSTIDEILDIDSSLFSYDEIKSMHANVYQHMANQADQNLYFKIHDAFTNDANNRPIVPENATKCAIYFVRNPLDVVISFANHNGDTIDKTIEQMALETNYLGHESGRQIMQPLLTWSQHYKSWTSIPSFPVYVLRYEDMLSDTFYVFKDILQKIGLEYSDEAINTAIDATSFEKLRKQEEKKGFKEKNPNSPRFFNNGRAGTWQGKLSEDQVNRIINDHSEVMKELGYFVA